MAACHVQNQLGTYLVWLLVGAVPMTSPRKAVSAVLTLAPILAASFQISGMLVEAPWLTLIFLFLITAISTYLNIALELGGFGVIIQVVVLNTFYAVIYDPGGYGWSTGALFGGCVLAFALITLFDNWLWPDPAEAILPEAIAASVVRNRARFLDVASFFLDERPGERPPEPPFTSGMPDQLALLDRARAEGISEHRRAVLLAAISRQERLHIQIDRLTIAARAELPHEVGLVRMMFQPEADETVRAIADALDELEREILTGVRTGPDNPPSPAANRARAALDAFDARIIELRPSFINRITAAEAANFGEFTESLHGIVRLIERPLDEPPADMPTSAAGPLRLWPQDPAVARYCTKTGLCVVVGYIIGLMAHRPELATILTTIIITALPTYGAAMRKMILRVVGALLGGGIAILAIMIVSPNFSTLPSYMLAIFIVLYASGYASLASGRTAYAGKQIATTFLLIFADLSPSLDVYGPLWRMWGIFIGTFVVTIVFFLFWPVYAGDSLLPRLRKVLRDALALAPGGGPSLTSLTAINALNTATMQVLSEIMAIAEDARLEGRTSLIDRDAVVQASGTLRRIANRFANIDRDLIAAPLPPLDDSASAAREAVFNALKTRLESWLAFYESEQCLSRDGAIALAARHSRAEISQPLETFSALLSADGFARIASWTLAQRRQILAELESLRRLEFLSFELNEYLSRVPVTTSLPATALALRQSPTPAN